MKTIFTLLISFLFIFSSCKKEQQQTQKPVTANDVENLTKTQILSAHPWKYQEVIYHFNPSTGKGKVVYKRGAGDNKYNFDNNRSVYSQNGNYDETDSVGTHNPGTWMFTNTENTALSITYTSNPSSPVSYNIQTLTAKKYNVVYHVGNNVIFAAFIAAPKN